LEVNVNPFQLAADFVESRSPDPYWADFVGDRLTERDEFCLEE
jgi:hypothetical protein